MEQVKHDVWLFVAGSNPYTHDRSLYAEYDELINPVDYGGVQVVGIGRVEIDAAQEEKEDAMDLEYQSDFIEITRINLVEVLHIPSATCNGLRLSDIPYRGAWLEQHMWGHDESGRRKLWKAKTSVALGGYYRIILAKESYKEDHMADFKFGKSVINLFPSSKEIMTLARAVVEARSTRPE